MGSRCWMDNGGADLFPENWDIARSTRPSTRGRGQFTFRLMAIADIRREYSLAGLRRADLDAHPIVQFRRWFDQAAGARSSGRVRASLIRLYKALLGLG